MEKFRNTFRIDSARLENWDYGSNAYYFVTICTKNRQYYFGEIISATSVETQHFASEPSDSSDSSTIETQHFASLQRKRIQPTEIGKIAIENWKNIPEHFPFVELDEFVLMPNHLHGIIHINKPDYQDWKPNQFAPQSQNLPSILRGYKASVKKYATMNNIEFGWQTRYHDRVVRSDEELDRIRKYIINNPDKWDRDKDNPEGILM